MRPIRRVSCFFTLVRARGNKDEESRDQRTGGRGRRKKVDPNGHQTHFPRSELFEEDYSPVRIHLSPPCEIISNQSSSRQPGLCIVVQTSQELFPCQRGCFYKSCLEEFQVHVKGEDHQALDPVGKISHIHSLGVEGFIPGGIQPTHSGGKIRPIAVLGGDIPRVLGDTVIRSVNRFNKFLRLLLS